MVVSSTLVNVSDDAEVRLVTLLAEAAPGHLLNPSFQEECQKSIQAGQVGALLDTVLNDAGAIAALLTIESNDEATAAFSLLSALAERAGRPVHQLADAIVTVDIPEKEQRKITLLSVLYNMRTNAKEKCLLLRHMIQLAGSTLSQSLLDPDATLGKLLVDEASSPLAPGQPRLVTLLDTWKVEEDRRDLYRTVASVMNINDLRKQRFLLLLVDSYSKDPSSIDSQAIEDAKEAATGAIRDPLSLFLHQRNMLSLPAIQALNKENQTLFELLKVFQEGKLSDYQAFIQSHGGDEIFQQLELDAQACTRNMRILSLCSLASEHEEIPYAVIAETLQLPADDDTQVESWVIAAVSSGLLQAKMDQLAHTVMVERSVVRRFDIEQWKALQSRLSSWKHNVANVLVSFKESQAALKQN